MKVIITKEIEPFWDLEYLKEKYRDSEAFEQEAIRLLMEDVSAVLDGATWEIEE